MVLKVFSGRTMHILVYIGLIVIPCSFGGLGASPENFLKPSFLQQQKMPLHKIGKMESV